MAANVGNKALKLLPMKLKSAFVLKSCLKKDNILLAFKRQLNLKNKNIYFLRGFV